MALEEVVLVKVGPEVYAIPQAVINRVDTAAAADGPPTVDLWGRLEVPGDMSPSERTMVICYRPLDQVGLLVDGVVGRDEAVIRPLPRRARHPGLLGAIVTGDGRVILVLNVAQLRRDSSD
jgi:chemotaxis protein histidine kinase CheA